MEYSCPECGKIIRDENLRYLFRERFGDFQYNSLEDETFPLIYSCSNCGCNIKFRASIPDPTFIFKGKMVEEFGWRGHREEKGE